MSNVPISPFDQPDPWIIKHNSIFYLTFTLGDRVEIWSSPTLEDFHSARKSVVWHGSQSEQWSANLWAPELHSLNGTWYIYFAANPPADGNAGHRTLILCSHDADPLNASAWEFRGPLKGVPTDQWAIDATVFTLHNPQTNARDLYCCYSGWPLGDHSDTQQDLFLVRLQDPETAISETLTCISRAHLPWERPDGGRRGVNEGPTFIDLPRSYVWPNGFQAVVFSAHGSWTSEYKLALLALVRPSDPCREDSWVKRQVPLLVSDEQMGPPFGPGHASFVPCDGEDDKIFAVYHGTERVDEGWANRKARVLKLDVACFASDARPVCCGHRSQRDGRPSVGMASAAPESRPGNASVQGTGGLADFLPVGHMPDAGQKVWGKLKKFF